MSQQNLPEALAELRSEVENLDDLDEVGQAKLNQMIDQLQRKLDDDNDDGNLLEQLSDSITHFEVAHPALTATLNNIMSLLSSSGI
jgi:hypothetical protein